MNIFMVMDGKLITTPPTSDILVGITRNTVKQLAKEQLALEVIERPIARTELYVCDELFFCGTGAQVAPVRSVDRRELRAAGAGPITKMLQGLYFDAVSTGSGVRKFFRRGKGRNMDKGECDEVCFADVGILAELCGNFVGVVARAGLEDELCRDNEWSGYSAGAANEGGVGVLQVCAD